MVISAELTPPVEVKEFTEYSSGKILQDTIKNLTKDLMFVRHSSAGHIYAAHDNVNVLV